MVAVNGALSNAAAASPAAAKAAAASAALGPNSVPIGSSDGSNRRDPRSNRQMILGVNVLGLGQRPAAWQSESLAPSSFIDREYWVRVGREAERGKLDALFLADAPSLVDPRTRPQGALEPTILLSAVAEATEHLGLIGTLSTTYNDPVELAARILTLDHIAGGRAGWNAVTTANAETAANFGAVEHLDRDARYRRAHEFVDFVARLWRHAGTGSPVRSEYFEDEAVLDLPRSPQGRPALVQAGGSPEGRRLAGERADAVFTAEMTFDEAIVNYARPREYARAIGRDPNSVKILPGFALILGSTEREALERYEKWEALAPAGLTASRLSGILGIDIDSFELDAPLPDWVTEVPEDPKRFGAGLSFRATTVRFARTHDLTVRQLLRAYGGYGHPIIIGTPQRVADTLTEWFLAGAADGFNLMPDVFPDGLTAVVDEVLPILRDRGLFRREYEHPTFRGRLRYELPQPVQRNETPS